jgi:hypothetical protein
VSIADARALPDGASVRIAGVLTTALGAIDSARNGFVQDGTAGIAVRLDAALPVPFAAGTTVVADGTLGSYFSLRVVTVTSAKVVVTGSAGLPDPLGSTTAAADETLEGIRLLVSGTVTEAPSALADGLGVTIDDGSGPLRIVVASAAQGTQSIGTGDVVTAIGPLGQRDSTGTGSAGYRLHATLDGELTVDTQTPSPTPIPTPSPTSSASVAPTPTPAPTLSQPPSPTPTASPTASPSISPAPTPTPTSSAMAAIPIADARARSVGSAVTVAGVVTAQPGRLGTPALMAIADSTGAIVVRLPDTAPRPSLGASVELSGAIADPYGQLEVRALTAFAITGSGPLPDPEAIVGTDLGEATEARLVAISGIVEGRPVKSTGGDLAIVVTTASGSARVLADASAGLGATFVGTGDRVRLTGIVGQHASRKGALDGYRIWLRGPADVVRTGTAPGASAGPSPSGHATSSVPPARTIAAAIAAGSGDVTIQGIVTAPATLLDATKRRIVVQDASGAIEALLPAGATPPGVGRRVRIAGEVGRAYGAPRIRAAAVTALGAGSIAPVELRATPGAAHEWRLVRVRGDLVEVHRSGDRWTAELLVGGARVLVVGLAGAGIPSSALVEGRTAVVSGIVRRPYPSATDRRFAVVPRSAADLVLGGAADDRGAGPASSGGASGPPAPAAASGAPGPIEIDLIDLAGHVGATVRVGGLVDSLEPDGFRLDDGTAIARIGLVGGAADLAGSLVVGDALTATGRVVRDGAGAGAEIRIEVSDPGLVVLAGDLDGTDPAPGDSDQAPAADGSGSADPSSNDAPLALGAGLPGPDLPGLGALGIALISLASLAVTLVRRRRLQRRLAVRIAARLATLGPPPERSRSAAAGPPAPEPGG